MICASGLCSAACDIDGGIVAAKAPNPENSCQACLPATSTNSWTTEPDGFTCDAGLTCHYGFCCSQMCGGNPVDSCVDDNNCGSCGRSCNVPNGCFASSCGTAASMPTARDSLTVVTGMDGLTYAIGGFIDAQVTAVPTVEAFNPRTNSWATFPPLPLAVEEAPAAANASGIFVFGGYNCTGADAGGTCAAGTGVQESSESFLGVGSSAWVVGAEMASEGAIDATDAAVVGGVFYMPGGFNLTNTQTFTPEGAGGAGIWGIGPSLPGMGAYDVGVSAGLDGTVYAIGGTPDLTTALAGVETLAPGAPSWGQAANLITPRCSFGAATDSAGRIYAIGGDNCAYLGTGYTIYSVTEVFNPDAGVWFDGGTLPKRATQLGCATGSDGRIYVIGGWSGAADLGTVQVFDPVNGYWIP
jgi:hypothetical protein